MADEPNFYDRLDAILDDCRAGHKHNDIVDALDALYGEQHAVTIGERDDARAEVERLRGEVESKRDLLRVAEESAWDAQQELERTDRRAEKAEADRDRLAEQVQRVRDLCAGGPGPHNERQIWISDVLAALDTEPGA